jgi:beta-phosphoglucomutase-like phosphatase (HAD superfamily)
LRRLETVIFDLDGVITNTSTFFNFKIWGKLAKEIGIKLPLIGLMNQ